MRIDELPKAQAKRGGVSLARYTLIPVRCKLRIESLSESSLEPFLHAGRALVFPDISHELGLQALGAQLAADVQSAFALRQSRHPRDKGRARAG